LAIYCLMSSELLYRFNKRNEVPVTRSFRHLLRASLVR
jgi:hypothetical protein